MPLAHLMVIRRGQGKKVDAGAALKVTMPVSDMLDDISKGKATYSGLYNLLEFYVLVYGAYTETLEQTTEESRPLLIERCDAIKAAVDVLKEKLPTAKAGKVVACSLGELTILGDAYTVATEAHQSLPEWAFISAYRKQEAYIRSQRQKAHKRPKRKRRKR